MNKRIKKLFSFFVVVSTISLLGFQLLAYPSDVQAQNYDWIIQFGSSVSTSTLDITSDSDGNLYITGNIQGAFPGQVSSGYSDAFVRKLDGNGNEVWTRQFGTSQPDGAAGIAIDQQGNIYIGGYTRGIFPGQVSAGGNDIFVRKYDNNGNVIWTRQFGTSYEDSASKLVVDNTGNIYFVGPISSGASDAVITNLWC